MEPTDVAPGMPFWSGVRWLVSCCSLLRSRSSENSSHRLLSACATEQKPRRGEAFAKLGVRPFFSFPTSCSNRFVFFLSNVSCRSRTGRDEIMR